MPAKGTTLLPNQFLDKDDYLLSADGRHQFIMQQDGNLVLYRLSDHRALWATGTNGRAVSKAIMQADGNLVIYGFPGPIWASNTNGKPNSYLILQTDGNVVIYEPTVPVWATGTNGQ